MKRFFVSADEVLAAAEKLQVGSSGGWVFAAEPIVEPEIYVWDQVKWAQGVSGIVYPVTISAPPVRFSSLAGGKSKLTVEMLP